MKQVMKILTLCVPFMIAACGGGGGGGGGNSGGSTPSDSTPNSFTFSAQTDVAPTTLTTSNSITVGGIDIASAISVTGGEFSVDGGAFTATAGTVNNGQSITVRQTSSASFSTTTQAILTIGGVSDQFDVTTIAADTVPDSFTFIDQSDVALDTLLESNLITIGGINSGAAISITGGEYSLNGAAFTSAAGTANAGETIVVRQTSSGTSVTKTDTTITIGGVSDTYSVTTLSDTTAPVVNVIFPPIKSLSYGDTVTLRGTATDDLSAITSLLVNGVAASTTDGFANWTATVPLVNGSNDLIVDITDFNNNNNSNAGSVSVLRTDTMFGNPTGIELDAANNRILIADQDIDAVTAVDLSSGIRSILSSVSTPFTGSEHTSFFNASDVVLDAARNRALVADPGIANIIAVDLDAGAKSFPFPLDSPELGFPADLEIDLANNRVFAAYSDANVVVSYDLDTGVRTIVSDDANTATVLTSPRAIAFDAANNRLLLGNNGINGIIGIIAVDLLTGNRTVFSDVNTPISGGPTLSAVEDIVIDGSVAYVAASSSIIAVQLSDGSRSIVSGLGLPDNSLPLITGAVGVEVDKANNRLLVIDNNNFLNTIITVDLSSGGFGTRSVVSQDNNTLNASGVRFAGLWGMALDSANNRLLTAERAARVMSVDTITGDSSIFSGAGIPDSNNNFFFYSLALDVDAINNRAIVLDLSANRMISVNLTDGSRLPFAVSATPMNINRWGIEVDEVNNRAFFVSSVDQQLFSVDLTTEAITLVSDNVLHEGVAFNRPFDVAVDAANNQIYVAGQNPEIYVVDLSDGSRSILTTTGPADTTILSSWNVVLDEANNRLLISDIARDMIVAVDLNTLERSVISSGVFPNSHNAFSYASEIIIDPSEPTRAWVSERGQNAILMLDLITGERVYFSR